VAWCKAASKGKTKWAYLYVPQQTFEVFGDNRLDVLARSCEPALQDLIDEAAVPQLTLAFGEVPRRRNRSIYQQNRLCCIAAAHQKMVQQAIGLFQFLEKRRGNRLHRYSRRCLGPLDEASRAVMLKFLGRTFRQSAKHSKVFEPDVSHLSKKDGEMCLRRGKDLRRTW